MTYGFGWPEDASLVSLDSPEAPVAVFKTLEVKISMSHQYRSSMINTYRSSDPRVADSLILLKVQWIKTVSKERSPRNLLINVFLSEGRRGAKNGKMENLSLLNFDC